MKLIVGLGNPGEEYAKTRHNFGFMVVDKFVARHGGGWSMKNKFSAMTAEVNIGGEKLVVIKPTTYYNLSGEAVQRVMAFYKIDVSDVLAIHDEMALPLGVIRTRRGGSDAGNNGVKSLINTIGANFARVRIGSGQTPTHDGDAQPAHGRRDYVLSGLDVADAKVLDGEQDIAAQIISEFASGEFVETTYRIIA